MIGSRRRAGELVERIAEVMRLHDEPRVMLLRPAQPRRVIRAAA
ncbi:MAG TPA: hypothetical protein VMS99_04760 [Acidimicrobiia bacterium]|nr:hypothetical protein [Acidimicrobiia bacterium]